MGKKMFQPVTTATKLIVILLIAINLKNNQLITAQQQQQEQQLQHQQRQYYQHHQQQQNGDENCETLPSEIHIIKEEYDELGRLQRTCNGEVQVNKCEGLCNSQVQPSVITPTGFLKECYCCRESFLRERLVTLTHCYDPDGARLTSQDVATMDVRLKEPAECRCFKCGDFSR